MHVTGIGYTLRGRVRIAPEDDLTCGDQALLGFRGLGFKGLGLRD